MIREFIDRVFGRRSHEKGYHFITVDGYTVPASRLSSDIRRRMLLSLIKKGDKEAIDYYIGEFGKESLLKEVL